MIYYLALWQHKFFNSHKNLQVGSENGPVINCILDPEEILTDPQHWPVAKFGTSPTDIDYLLMDCDSRLTFCCSVEGRRSPTPSSCVTSVTTDTISSSYICSTWFQRCGTVTVFYGSGSGSGSDFWKLWLRFLLLKSCGSGSGSFFWKVPVPVPVPVPAPAPNQDHKKQIFPKKI